MAVLSRANTVSSVMELVVLDRGSHLDAGKQVLSLIDGIVQGVDGLYECQRGRPRPHLTKHKHSLLLV